MIGYLMNLNGRYGSAILCLNITFVLLLIAFKRLDGFNSIRLPPRL